MPAPEARVAFAAIENSDRFASRWRPWATRLGVRSSVEITVLGDGAEWIWKRAARHFPDASGVLDIYDALEHLGKPPRLSSARARRRPRIGSNKVVVDCSPGAGQRSTPSFSRASVDSAPEPDAGIWTPWKWYFSKQIDHMPYAERLSEGRVLGSGLVEGTAKNPIGRRLKQTGARWRLRRVNRVATLCCISASDLWGSYWKHQNAKIG